MRVTKAIREYVEDEIYKKYEAAEKEVGREYEAEKEKVIEGLNQILNRAQKEAVEYLKLTGFEFAPRYTSDRLFGITHSIAKKDVEEEIYRKRNELRSNKHNKIKQVLFDLEMGETQKSELRQILDNITIE